MSLMIPTLAAAFAAFCLWLTVRIVNKRERWAKWTAVMTALLVLYIASFGVSCRLGHHRILSARTIYWVYRPVFAVWFAGPEFAQTAISRYFNFACGTGPRRISYLVHELEAIEGDWDSK